jgi:hypothetical protein
MPIAPNVSATKQKNNEKVINQLDFILGVISEYIVAVAQNTGTKI